MPPGSWNMPISKIQSLKILQSRRQVLNAFLKESRRNAIHTRGFKGHKGHNSPNHPIVCDYLFSNNLLILPTIYHRKINWENRIKTTLEFGKWTLGISARVSSPEFVKLPLGNLMVFNLQLLSLAMNFITLAIVETSSISSQSYH